MAEAHGFLRSQDLGNTGNTLFELPDSFPAPLSVTPLFELQRASGGKRRPGETGA